MAALYDGNGDRVFRLDYRKNADYISNKAGTAENIYYNYASGGIDYNHDMIKDEILIPNNINANSSINYELTGYINDINTEHTQVLMEYGANQSITNVYEYGEQRNSATINGSKGYYIYDGRGSVSSLAGNSGGNMVSYTYDAYGITSPTANTLNNPYQYNAEYTDSSTGLQYLRARYYDSSTGRFITKDTELGSTQKPITRNLYTYAGNNPLNITDPSGHGWFKNAWNKVKKTASKVVSTVKKGYNTAKNWVSNHVVKPVKSFFGKAKTTVQRAYNTGKTYVQKKWNDTKRAYNTTKTWVGNTARHIYNDYVPPKVRKAMEETMHFVCTTTDKIVKNTKEFVQNVDWKKVAIGVGTTLAVTAAVVATGGAAAPVLIGAAVGAGASTGVSIVSGAIQGKSPAEIAKDSSDAFMWGAIGGSFGGGTTSVLKSTGKSAANSFVKQNLIEGGVDTVVDLSETAVRNDGELTGKDIVKSVASNIGGALINVPDTPSTTRNQFADGISNKKTYQTYTKTNQTTGEVYSGRTSGYGTPLENIRKRDKNHHMNDKGFGPAKLDKTSDSYDAIRGREQDLIEFNGGAKSTGGTSGNTINGIGPKNPKKDKYISASRNEFGEVK